MNYPTAHFRVHFRALRRKLVLGRPKEKPIDRPVWLFIDGSGTFGGHQVMLLRWLQELHAQNDIHAVLMACADTRLVDQAEAHADLAVLAARSEAAGGTLRRLKQLIHDLYVLLATLRATRPNLVIIAEGCLLAQAPFMLLNWLLGVPTLIYVPLIEPASNMGFARGRHRDWLVQHVYRHLPKAWLTITQGQALQLCEWAHLTQPIFCLPNALAPAIELAQMPPRSAHRPLRVLVLGRLDAHQKGLDSLLEYLRAHPHLGHELQVNLVGEGPYRDHIMATLQADATLSQWVSVRPWAATIEVMGEHDVLLLASRYEGVPLVVLEAMALGLPVVATDLPGIRDLLPVSFRFAVDDYDMAMEMLRATTITSVRAALIERNRQVVLKQASGVVFAKAVRNLTGQLLDLTGDAQPQVQLLDDNATVDL